MKQRLPFLGLCTVALATLVLLGRLPPPTRRAVPGPSPDAMEGYVEHVVDGDTVDIRDLGRVRIIGVDTPERGDPGFDEATQFVEAKCLGRWVRVDVCQVKSRDKYNRTRALVYYDEGGKWHGLAEELILRCLGDARSLQPCHIEDAYWAAVQARAAAHPIQE